MGEAHKLDRHYRYTKQAFGDKHFNLMFSDHKRPGGDSLREVSARGLCERSLREVSARELYILVRAAVLNSSLPVDDKFPETFFLSHEVYCLDDLLPSVFSLPMRSNNLWDRKRCLRKKQFQKFIPGRDFLHHVWITSKVEELYSALRNKTLKTTIMKSAH